MRKPLLLALFLCVFAVLHFYVFANDNTNVEVTIKPGDLYAKKPPKVNDMFFEKKMGTTVLTTKLEGPLNIHDMRSLGEGLSVSVYADQFKAVGTDDGLLLPKGSLVLSYPENIVSKNEVKTLPTVLNDHLWVVDNSIPVTVIKTDKKSSKGDFDITFPKDSLSLTVLVNKDNEYMFNDGITYHTNLTWTITAGP